MTPIPTPYDITPIPYFPYSPGLFEWCIIILGFIGIGILIFCGPSFKDRIKKTRSIRFAKLELSGLLGNVDPSRQLSKISVVRISNILKRLLEILLSSNISSMSPSELSSFRARQSEPSLLKLLEIVERLDSVRYTEDKDVCDLTRGDVEITLRLLDQLEQRGAK